MMSKEKKEYVILGAVLLVTLAVLYFGLFKPKSAPQANLTANSPTPGMSSSNGGVTPSVSKPFLPNGTKLDLQILSDPRFTTLIPPSYPTVNLGEVGKDNPFGQ